MNAPPLVERLARAAAALDPVRLDELPAEALLQVRVDRKYVVAPALADALFEAMAERVRVLEVDGERCAGYQSVYFDTPDRALFRMAARVAPWRSKVRTRRYCIDGTVMLEVKARTRSGATAKTRRPQPPQRRLSLDPGDLEFVTAHLARPVPVGLLAPVLETTYRRCTLVDTAGVGRVTIDAGLRCALPDGPAVATPGHLIVETKTAGRPGAADRWLWSHGVRPLPFSKFCVGLAALEPGLPANRWARPLRRYVTPWPVPGERGIV